MEHIGVKDMLRLVAESDRGWLLIGATPAARALHKALGQSKGLHKVAFWTDKKYAFFRECGLPVIEYTDILWECVDGVIIGGKMALTFAEEVLRRCPLPRVGMYCLKSDTEGLPDYPYPDIHYTDRCEDQKLLLLDPADLITEDRMDIVIRCMAARELARGIEGEAVSLYKKLTLSMNDGEEFVRPFTTCAYFSLYSEKKGTDEFCRSFRSLIDSMKERGFEKAGHIPLSENYGVINGTHRIAAAVLLGMKVYARRYIGYGEPFLSFRPEQLSSRGFTREEIQRIYDAYINIKQRKEEKL